MTQAAYLMTYGEKLDLLLHDCVVKANAYIEYVSVHGQYSACNKRKTEWEKAEDIYACLLNSIKLNFIKLDSTITDLIANKCLKGLR